MLKCKISYGDGKKVNKMDYDIDKAYIMGLQFDGNGKYVGWSNLFDYSSQEGIRASEELPGVVNKTYKFISLLDIANEIKLKQSDDNFKPTNYIDITETVLQLNNAQTRPEKIRIYAKLLNRLQKLVDKDIYLTWNPDILNNEIIKDLNTHSHTILPRNLIEDGHKNYISTHIQNTVLNLRNMIAAYSPITMDDFRDAAADSPLGKQATEMTLLDPTTKLIMLFQNITGKNVIGIAANGEKASFMWHYYINDVIRNHKNDAKKIQYSSFKFNTSRIAGRSSGQMLEITINTLPETNFEDIDYELMEKYGYKLSGDITVDLMISQILSAATDNAKELILPKVNGGTKLAKMHLFLVTLGFNIDDVVKFMTSDVANFINAVSDDNVFTNYHISVQQAIKLAKGDYSGLVNSYISQKTKGIYLQMDEYKQLFNNLNSGNLKLAKAALEDSRFNIDKSKKYYIELNDLVNVIERIQALQNFSNTDVEVLADINEFENVFDGANEFSNFGRLLGLNQGLPTSKLDLQKLVSFMQSILFDRENEKNKDSVPEVLDIIKFVNDDEYKTQIKDRYDAVKKCINIFDAIDTIPQFLSIFKLLKAEMVVDDNVSIKSRKFNKLYLEMKDMGLKPDDDYLMRMLKAIDNAIIAKFVSEKLGMKIHYAKDVKMPDEDYAIVDAANYGTIKFESMIDVAKFKYLFEHTIIPNLQKGKYYILNAKGELELKEDPKLALNKFIKSLIFGYSNEMPLYKCDLDMLLANNTIESRKKFMEYSKGLQSLEKINDAANPLADLFVLYNLIVNKNQYGSDRFTSLFDSIIRNNQEMFHKNKNLSLISKYLNFVGNLDWSRNDTDLNISLMEVMYYAAQIVNSPLGLKNPSYLLNEDGKLMLYTKSGKHSSYTPSTSILTKKLGETEESFQTRLRTAQEYQTLGYVVKENIQMAINFIESLQFNLDNILKDLALDAMMFIRKIC